MEIATTPSVTLSPSAPVAEPPAAARPGKSAQSVGHLAKAAIADARAAGIDLPKNAQGMAASQIARGADPASVFAALIEPEPFTPGDGTDIPVEDPAIDPATDPATDSATDPAPAPVSDAVAGYGDAGVALTDAERALELLMQA